MARKKQPVCPGCRKPVCLASVRTARCLCCGAALCRPPTPEEISVWRREVRRARLAVRPMIRRIVVVSVTLWCLGGAGVLCLRWWVIGKEAADGPTLTFPRHAGAVLPVAGVLLLLPLIGVSVLLGHCLGRRWRPGP